MRKIYTISVLLLSLSAYAQLEEVQEEPSSKSGYVFEQNGSTIDVDREVKMNQQQILLAGNTRGIEKVENPSNPTIYKTTAANGDELWVLSNGVVVRNLTQEANYSKEPMSILRSNTEIKVTQVNISAPSENIQATTSESITTSSESIPDLGNTETTTLTPITDTAILKVEENVSKTDNTTVDNTTVTSSTENITKENTNISQSNTIDEDLTAKGLPGDINITADEVGDVSSLFSVSYDDMSKEEQKQYKKNEKKIKKQLERELKKESKK